MSQHICYITGTRADFGLMRQTLSAIANHDQLMLSIIATGMHLSEAHGSTITEIPGDGLPEPFVVPIELGEPSGALMASNIGLMVRGFTEILATERPDTVLLLGDRGEMLAGAIAAIHLNIRVAHIHGGERSGTIDEPVRHAISKLSHLHLVATRESARRLEMMGEKPADIHVVGAPGLDGLVESARLTKPELTAMFNLQNDMPLALLVLHPVVQETGQHHRQGEVLIQALRAAGLQVVALKPNSDAGGQAIAALLDQAAGRGEVVLRTHLARDTFVSLMRAADVMIGNSSSGIIEAATFGTPVINLGTRQNLRERNANVIDVEFDIEAIRSALVTALAGGRHPPGNVYGDGKSAARIVAHLLEAPSDGQMYKTNAY